VLVLRNLYWLGLACLVSAAVLGAVAITDHHRKQQRINDAQVAAYFCRVQHTHCGAESWHKIEADWQTRQIMYEVAVVALGGLGLLVIGYRLARGGGAMTSRKRSGR
jgi:hypothetical protein